MHEIFKNFFIEKMAYLVVENGIVTDAGDLLLKYLNYSRDDLVGIYEDEVFGMLTGGNIGAKPEEETKSYFLLTKNKETVFFNIQAYSDKSEHKKLYIFQKIENLKTSYDLSIIHQLVSNSPLGVALFSVPDIILINANQSWLNRLDEPFNRKEESIGKSIDEIITGWDGSVFENIWNTVLSSKKSCYIPEYRYSGLKKGISYWDISITPIFEDDKVAYFIESTYDVTEMVINRDRLKIQREQLFKQYQQFETVVENMSDALFIIYPNYKTISLNQAAHIIKHLFCDFQYYGNPQEQIKYYDSKEKQISFPELPIFKIPKGEQFKSQIITVKTPEEIYHFSISGRPVHDESSSIIFSIVCIRDVTTQVINDNYILQVEKEKKKYLERMMELKDNFLTLVSHEFKTPLTVIGTAIQAIEIFCGQELSEKAKRYLKTIKQNSLRQLRLVNNLLDITRGTAGQIRLYNRNIDIVDLTRMITESVKIYAAQKNLSIMFSSDHAEKIIFIDDEKYERVLLNILSNAIKFTPKGKNVYVNLFFEANYINIEVRDEGVGIPQEKIDIIFEKFGQVDNSFSRQAEGSGIGLYLVKSFVERMGGVITAKSTLYEGSTFLIRLPDIPPQKDEGDNFYKEVDNKRITNTMSIEFSDIYL
jgi:signal transduction histidine kinase/PAS domain-containing protein